MAFFYLLGLILGAMLPLTAEEEWAALFWGLAGASVPALGLLLVRLLPVVLSFCVLRLGNPWLLIPIVFGKAFLFAFLSAGILVGFGEAGWLLRLLLSFSDILSLPLLWLLWLPAGDGADRTLRFGAAVLFTVILCCFDHFVVLPFGAALLS